MITRQKIGQSRKTTTTIVAISFFRLLLFPNQFIDSLNLFSLKYVEIVRRKLILVTLVAKRVNTNHKCCWDKFIMIRTSSETQGQLVGMIESSRLQYSSQIVETDTVSLEFSGKFLRFLLLTLLFSL